MKIVNIQEAKTHLSRLLQEVALGEDMVIARVSIKSRRPRSRSAGHDRRSVIHAYEVDIIAC
jgi:antitoxin (DNA-binding transcriptional repressor) of toxin-antitoxin stability system